MHFSWGVLWHPVQGQGKTVVKYSERSVFVLYCAWILGPVSIQLKWLADDINQTHSTLPFSTCQAHSFTGWQPVDWAVQPKTKSSFLPSPSPYPRLSFPPTYTVEPFSCLISIPSVLPSFFSFSFLLFILFLLFVYLACISSPTRHAPPSSFITITTTTTISSFLAIHPRRGNIAPPSPILPPGLRRLPPLRHSPCAANAHKHTNSTRRLAGR